MITSGVNVNKINCYNSFISTFFLSMNFKVTFACVSYLSRIDVTVMKYVLFLLVAEDECFHFLAFKIQLKKINPFSINRSRTWHVVSQRISHFPPNLIYKLFNDHNWFNINRIFIHSLLGSVSMLYYTNSRCGSAHTQYATAGRYRLKTFFVPGREGWHWYWIRKTHSLHYICARAR